MESKIKDLTLIVFIGCILVACGEGEGYFSEKSAPAAIEQIKSTKIKHPHSVEDVIVKIGGVNMSIPSKYYVSSGKNHKEEFVSLSMWALLPDFEGYNPSDPENYNDFHQVKGVGKGRRLTIFIERSHGKSSLSVLFQGIKPWTRKIESRKPIGIEYELEKYISWSGDHEYWNFDSHDRPIHKMNCSSKSETEDYFPSCTLYWLSNKGVSIKADFKKEYAPLWKAIITKINEIIG